MRVRPREPFDYVPGQSVPVEIPQRPRLWRYYSPANAPRDDSSLDFHVQLVDGGQVSAAVVCSVRVGDVVRLGAPSGDRLTFPDDGARKVLMIAGGTGLAPLRAVLEQIDRRWHADGTGPHVQLFHGVRMPWNFYERELLTQLSGRPWFSYTEVVSDDPSYPGHRGLVGTVAAENGDWSGGLVMVCGSASMVTHTVSELTTAGAPPDAIRVERWAVAENDRQNHEAERPGDDS